MVCENISGIHFSGGLKKKNVRMFKDFTNGILITKNKSTKLLVLQVYSSLCKAFRVKRWTATSLLDWGFKFNCTHPELTSRCLASFYGMLSVIILNKIILWEFCCVSLYPFYHQPSQSMMPSPPCFKEGWCAICSDLSTAFCSEHLGAFSYLQGACKQVYRLTGDILGTDVGMLHPQETHSLLRGSPLETTHASCLDLCWEYLLFYIMYFE